MAEFASYPMSDVTLILERAQQDSEPVTLSKNGGIHPSDPSC